jgi:acetyl esterase/lipase
VQNLKNRRTTSVLGMLGGWMVTAAVGLAISPRTPGRRLSYYALVFGARAPQLSALGVAFALLAAKARWNNARSGGLAAASAAIGLIATAISAGLTLALARAARVADVSVDPREVLSGPAVRPLRPETLVFALRGGAELRADVYRSVDRKSRASAVVVVHGGAWRHGGKSENPSFNWWLAAQGYVVFDIEYRLAHAGNWRDAVDDIWCATAWLREHADELDIDAERTTLLGRSAGGHLVLLAAYTAPVILQPRAVVAFYASSDLAQEYAEARGRHAADLRPALEALLGGSPHVAGDVYREASPLTHVSATVPPTFLVHGTWDRAVSVEQSRRLYAALQEVGVAADLLELPGARHAFDIVSSGLASALTRAALLRFLKAVT